MDKQFGKLFDRWTNALPPLILALLPLLFFWRLITPFYPDQMQIVAGDFTEQYFPLRAFAAQEWVNGRVPLWNPYLYGGQPALADIQSGALYPPHVIEALLLGWGGPLLGQNIGFPVWALELQVIFHFSLAALGMYAFAQFTARQTGASLRRARFAGIIASLVFTYGGYLTGFPVQQLTILETSAWLPWVMWGLAIANERIKNRESKNLPRPIAGTAFAFALAILAGHPQTVLYIFYLSLAYTLFRAFSSVALPLRLRPIILRLTPWLIMVMLGGAIAAPQLLPTAEFIRHSVRADMSYQAVSAGLPLNELISILYPGFFGGSPEYVGIITLILIALALTLTRPRPIIYFWGGVSLVGLLLAFGGYTFLYSFFYLLVPGFEAVRQQERSFLVYAFGMAMLAGYGALALSGPMPKSIRKRYTLFEHNLRIAGVTAVFLTAFLLYGSTIAAARGDEANLFYGVLRHHLFGLMIFGGTLILLMLRSGRWLARWPGMTLVAIWLAFNLFTVNWQFNLEQPGESDIFSPRGVTQFLQNTFSEAVEPARIASGGLLPGGNSAASVYNLPDLTGNTPLHLATPDMFFEQMPSWRMWQLMNVRYVVSDRDISGPGLTPVFATDDLWVFEIDDPFPRAWLVSQTEVIPEPNLALSRLASDEFDLRKKAVVTQPLPQPPGVQSATGMVQVTQISPTRLTASVETGGEQLLVFSQINYPGWRATVDGVPAEVVPVNLTLMGVTVPAGQHTVDWVFEPASFRWGMIISIAGILLTGMIAGSSAIFKIKMPEFLLSLGILCMF